MEIIEKLLKELLKEVDTVEGIEKHLAKGSTGLEELLRKRRAIFILDEKSFHLNDFVILYGNFILDRFGRLFNIITVSYESQPLVYKSAPHVDISLFYKGKGYAIPLVTPESISRYLDKDKEVLSKKKINASFWADIHFGDCDITETPELE